MKKNLLILMVFIAVTKLAAQQSDVWENVSGQPVKASEKLRATSYADHEKLYLFNINSLQDKLANASDRFSGKAGIVISIPNTEGQLEQFSVWEKSNFEPALQARFPQIRSYVGKGITDKKATLFFSVSPAGIETMILRADKGSEFIEPYTKDNSVYVLFDSKTRTDAALPFVCSTEDKAIGKELATGIAARSNAGVLKTMRLALSCTGEYGVYHGGTVALALAAMNATMTRVNGVFNVDLALQLNIIANDTDVIYTNATTDPYADAANMGQWNAQLQANLTSTIGEANYDIGHLFGATGGGGNAGCIGCVCNNGKGSGITSPADGIPKGDNFDIDYVAHEMGHQLGGNHTFSHNPEDSGVNVEPGSGSTIMGYAGIVAGLNVQAHSDPYFVYPSVLQIQNNLANKTCTVNIPLTNIAPEVTTDTGFTIPKSTPFILTGSAVDPDSSTLTYTWEQNDSAFTSTQSSSSESIGTPTKLNGPMFRSFNPTSQPVRMFPAINRVLTNNLTNSYECIPSVTRDLNFTLTARDNSVLGGQTNTAATVVHVNADAGPFVVTAPNTNVALTPGSNQTVTWNVAGTNANGINAAFVDIYLSTDSGATYPTLLASKVPNDGSETVTIPATSGNVNRVMVKANKNIFFDISNANFNIPAATATQAIAFKGVEGEQNKIICSENSVVYNFDYLALAGYSATSTFTATGNPAGTTVTFSQPSATTSGTIGMTIGNLNAAASGFYTIVVTSTSGSIIKNVNFYLSLGVSPVVLSSPANLATALNTNVTLNWAVAQNASMYNVQVATDADFSNILTSDTTTNNSYQLSGLSDLTAYYWRVAPTNASCAGSFSTAFKFATGQVQCASTASTNVPVAISSTGSPTIVSVLNVPTGSVISDLNATVRINHTYVSDLTVYLRSPAGTEIVLLSAQCGSSNNINATFDDAGTTLVCGTTPAVGGTIKPQDALSAFNGENSGGTWTLTVSDAEAPDGGSLVSWSINACHVEDLPLGITDPKLFNFAVYPNPNKGAFHIQSDKLNSDKVTVMVYDIQGRVIFTNNYKGTGTFNESISLKNAQAGVYLVSVSDGENKEVKRIVIQ